MYTQKEEKQSPLLVWTSLPSENLKSSPHSYNKEHVLQYLLLSKSVPASWIQPGTKSLVKIKPYLLKENAKENRSIRCAAMTMNLCLGGDERQFKKDRGQVERGRMWVIYVWRKTKVDWRGKWELARKHRSWTKTQKKSWGKHITQTTEKIKPQN